MSNLSWDELSAAPPAGDDTLNWDSLSKEPPPPPGVMGSAGRGLKHGIYGLAEAVNTGLQFIGNRAGLPSVAEQGQSGAEYWAEKAKPFEPQKEIQGAIYDNPELLLKGSWWAYNLADTAPSLAAAIIPGVGAARYISVGGKAIGLTEKVIERLAIAGGSIAGGAAGGALEGAQTYQEVLKRGAPEEEAAVAGSMMALASAALNAISVGKTILPSKAGALRRFLTTGAVEGLTEWAEEPAEGAILSGTSVAKPEDDPKQRAIQGLNVLPVAAVMGGGAGLIATPADTTEPNQPAPPVIPGVDQPGSPGPLATGSIEQAAADEEAKTAAGVQAIDAAQDIDSIARAAVAATSQPIGPNAPGLLDSPAFTPEQERELIMGARNLQGEEQIAAADQEAADLGEMPARAPWTAPEDTETGKTAIQLAFEAADAKRTAEIRGLISSPIEGGTDAIQEQGADAGGILGSAGQGNTGQGQDLGQGNAQPQAVAGAGPVQGAPQGQGADQQQGVVSPQVVAGIPVDQQSDEQLRALATAPDTPATTRHAAVAALQARAQAKPIEPVAPPPPPPEAAKPVGPVLQNRNRASPALIDQMHQIAAAPDPARLSFSRDFTTGAPTVIPDGATIPTAQLGNEEQVVTAKRAIPVRYAVVEASSLLPSHNLNGIPNDEYATGTAGKYRVIAGNGRAAGLQGAYTKGTTLRYIDGIIADTNLHGVPRETINGMKQPVLVRIMADSDVTENLGDETNVQVGAELTPAEKAANDARRIDVSAIEFGDDGEITLAAVKQFVNGMPETERAGLLDQNGEPTRQAYDRLTNAAFMESYGDPALVEIQAQATDTEARTIIAGMVRAAGAMARLKDAGNADFRSIVIEAAKAAINAKRRGISIAKMVQQADLDMHPESRFVLEFFATNIRSAAKIGEGLARLANSAAHEAGLPDEDMFGAVQKRTRAQLLENLNDPESKADTGEQGRPGDGQENAGGAAVDRPGQAGNEVDDGGRPGAQGRKIVDGKIQTLTGRLITAPPAIRTDTNQKATADVKRVDAWLLAQGIAEATARNDDFVQTLFKGLDAKRLSQGDKDMLNEYLFGETDPKFSAEQARAVYNPNQGGLSFDEPAAAPASAPPQTGAPTTDWKGRPWDGKPFISDEEVDSEVRPGDIGTGPKNNPYQDRAGAVGRIVRERLHDTHKIVQVGANAFVVRPAGNTGGRIVQPSPAAPGKMAGFKAEVAAQKERRASIVATATKAVETAGGLEGKSKSRPNHRLLLSKGTTEAPFRVTSFDENGPIGHRDYNSIDEAVNEFIPTDIEIQKPAEGAEPVRATGEPTEAQRANYKRQQELMRGMPNNVGRLKAEGRVSAGLQAKMDELDRLEKDLPQTSEAWQTIMTEHRGEHDKTLEKWRADRVAKAKARIEKAGFAIGQKVSMYIPPMFIGAPATSYEGVIRVSKNGNVSVHTGRGAFDLFRNPWEAVEERPDLALTPISTTQQAAEAAAADKAKAEAEAEAKRQEEAERQKKIDAEIKARNEIGAASFELTAPAAGDKKAMKAASDKAALDQLAGQGGLFQQSPVYQAVTALQGAVADLAKAIALGAENAAEQPLSAEQRKGPQQGQATPQLDLFAETDVSRQENPQPPILVEPAQRGILRAGFDKIDTAEKAAHTFAALRKAPREYFQMLLTDKNNKPLAVFDLFAGTITQTSVYPREVLTAAYATPGATKIWFAHNHPSGIAEPSHADVVLTKTLGQGLGPDLGITFQGHIIIAGNTALWFDGDGNRKGVNIPPASRKYEIPIMERVIKRQSFAAKEGLSTPAAARDYIEKNKITEPGLILMDSQHRVLMFWPMARKDMAGLRTKDANTGFGALARLISKINPGAAFVVDATADNTTVSAAASNLKAALGMFDVQLLDAFSKDSNGVLVSAQERGSLASPMTFFSRKDQTDTAAFKDWFAGSKAVDEAGNPLVVYHGTPTPGFTKFARGRGMGGPLGSWFASTGEAADQFNRTRYADQGGATYPVYLSIKKPMEYRGWTEFTDHVSKIGKGKSVEDGVKALRRQLIARGYDGVVIRGSTTDMGGLRDDWVAFDPKQIKSATANRGTFDRNSADIRYSQREKEVRVNPSDLSRGILSRMDMRLKALGYDSRGSDDVRTMLQTRIARDGVITHPDWIQAYEAAVSGAQRTREHNDAKAAEKGKATNVDFARMRELGLTEDWREAGYITPRGSLIDLSGKKEGSERGQRSYDHREAGGTLGMQEYMALGNIRIDSNSGSMDISREPTTEQYRKIAKFAENRGGEVTLDLEGGLGEQRGDYYQRPERTFSREYPIDTKPARIIADIRKFFAGEKPVDLPEYMQPWYYSALARGIETATMKSAPAAGWKSYIQGLVNKGTVKQAEIEATGINDWLATQEGKVTKEQVQAFMEQGGVKVTETVLGGAQDAVVRAEKALIEQAEREHMTQQGAREYALAAARGELSEAQAEMMSAEMRPLVDQLSQAYAAREVQGPEIQTKFESYVLPGAVPGSYRELVLTLPTTKKPGWRVRWKPEGISRPYDTQAEAQKALEQSGQRGEVYEWTQPLTPEFNSSHFPDAGNYLAHTRVNDRMVPVANIEASMPELTARLKAEGRTEAKMLGVEELQDDRAQAARKYWKEKVEQRAKKDGITVEEAKKLVPTDIAFTEKVVAPAPFQGKTEAWTALLLKRILRYAAEGGYDGIYWTRGDQQVERYTSALRKAVDVIEWKKTPEGVQIVGYKGREHSLNVPDNTYRRAATAVMSNDNLGFDSPREALDAVFESRHDWFNRWEVQNMADQDAIQTYIEQRRRAEPTRDKVVDTTEKESALSDAIGKSMADRIRNDPNQTGTIEGENITVSDTGMAGYYDRIVPKVAQEVAKKVGGGKVVEIDVPMHSTDFGGEKISKQQSLEITPAMREKIMGGLPLFRSQAANRGGMAPAAIKTQLTQAIEKLTIPTVIHNDVEAARKATAVDIPDTARAMFHAETVHLFAGSLDTALEVESAFWHEVQHAGLHRLYGDDAAGYERALTRIASLNRNIRQNAAMWRGKYGQEAHKRAKEYGMTEAEATRYVQLQSYDEALADLSGANAKIAGLKQFLAAVQKFLRAIGLTNLADAMENATDAEALALIAKARNAVMKQDAYIDIAAVGNLQADGVQFIQDAKGDEDGFWKTLRRRVGERDGRGGRESDRLRFTLAELSAAYAGEDRGHHRTGQVVVNKARGQELLQWKDSIAGFDGYYTIGQWFGDRLDLDVVPLDVAGTIKPSALYESASDLSILQLSLTKDGDRYELHITDPDPGAPGYNALKAQDRITPTGDLTADGHPYNRVILDKGDPTFKALLMELFRRFGVSLGYAPDVFWNARETGAGRRPGGLTPAQIEAKFNLKDQTETPEFKAWFKDSKVVDAEGKPLVVYHGTPNEIEKGEFYGRELAGWFAEKASTTEAYTNRSDDEDQAPSIYPVYLAIKSPLDLESKGINAETVISASDLVRRAGLSGKLENWNTNYTGEAWELVNSADFQRAAESAGYDGARLIERSDVTWAAFHPTQIKSAIGNRGAFDANNPDIRFSQPTWTESLPQAQKDALVKAGVITHDKTLGERARELTADFGKKFTQGVFDQFAPLKELDYRAYILARMSRGSDGGLEAMMMYGRPYMDGGALNVGMEDGGLLNVFQGLQGEHDRFLAWIAGNRAEQLKAEGRENLFTDDDISALKDLDQGAMPDGSDRAVLFAETHEKFNAYMNAILDIAEETGLIDAESREVWAKDFYVPFYRAMEEGAGGPTIKSGLVNQYAFKKLKGGSENLKDLMANTMMNWSHLLSASLKNQGARASLEAAEAVGAARVIHGQEKGAVSALVDGERVWYEVEDPFLLDAITAMEWSGFKGPAMEALVKFKRALTIGVTANPTFKIRNSLRDAIASIAQGNLSYNAAKNLAQGWRATAHSSQTRASMMASGGLMRFGTMLEGNEAAHTKRLIEAGVDANSILDKPHKVVAMLQKMWDTYQEFGDRGEQVNRAALYEQLRARGLTHLEASFQARDLLDFSMQGKWAAVRFLTQVVPFMNARLQGMYKLGRAAHEDPKRMAYVIGALSLASMALLLWYSDDDDWKKRDDWDRDQYWWFKIGGQAFRIPKPFEVGAVASVAERSLEYLISKERDPGKRFMKSMGNMVSNNLSMNPIPQLVKPLIDIYANKDSFTGRQIETEGMQHLSKGERIGRGTTLPAQILGKLDPTSTFSPVQVDFLARAYFGWLGTTALVTLDYGLRPFSGLPGKPEAKLRDFPVIGNFTEGLPANQSRYVTLFYDEAKAIHEAYADWRSAIKMGNAGKAAEILKDKGDLIRQEKATAHIQRVLGVLNQQERKIEIDSTISPQEKRARIDAIAAQKDRIARTITQRAQR